MNILAILFFPMTLPGDLPCSQPVTNTMDVQMVVADRHDLSGNRQDLLYSDLNRAARARQTDDSGAIAGADTDDLIFYLSSHAQAVGDTSGSTMTPWLELRPISAVGRGALNGPVQATPVIDGGACARSATYVPASDPASPSGG